MKKMMKAVAATALAVIGLMGASGAKAACSAATLAGNWGTRSFYIYQGLFSSAASIYTFNAATGRFSATGVGSTTGYSATSGTARGSYSLSASCLGSLTGTNSAGITFTAHFVITEGGRTLEGEVQSASKITGTFTGHKL